MLRVVQGVMGVNQRKMHWPSWGRNMAISLATVGAMYGLLFAHCLWGAAIVTVAGMLLIWRLDPREKEES